MNLLEVKNICKTYGSGETAVKALKDVSFSVPKGEYVAVVGESGSGKSTLLNMIGALDTPTTGKVLIDGKDIFAMDERKLTVFRRRNIGFIFQAFNLVPELTVEQNIIFPVLAILKAADTGGNFWIIIASALAVFIIVQAIQDGFIVPRVMGKITGLNPAIILLSLSIWGSLMGMLGMIIALPLTTLMLSYYQRFIINREKIHKFEQTDNQQEE